MTKLGEIGISVSEVTIALGSLNDRLNNLEPMYRAWGNRLYAITVRSFKRQASPDGKPWKQLNPKYRRYKEGFAARNKQRRSSRRGSATPTRNRPSPVAGGKKMLRWTDSLYDSIYTRSTGDGVEFGSALKVGSYSLALIHQEGADRANIPARPFMPLDQSGKLLPEVERELVEIAIDYLTRG